MQQKLRLLAVVLALVVIAGLALLVSRDRRQPERDLLSLSHRVSVLQPRAVSIDAEVTPAYLTASAEAENADLERGDPVQLTPAILELGQRLADRPRLLFELVHDNYVYEPYYGAKKGSFETSQALSGNDLDLAALLISYFRAAGIPCRFVRGVIEMPLARASNWFGVRSEAALLKALAASGVPHSRRPDAIRMEHFWVAARIQDRWHSFDPAFKQYVETEPVDLAGLLEADVLDLDWRLGEAGAAMQAPVPTVGVSQLQELVERGAERLRRHLALQPLERWRELLGERRIVPSREAPRDPYRVVAVLGEFAQLPEELKHKITVTVGDLEHTDTTANWNRRRTTLHFSGQTGEAVARLMVSNKVVATSSPVGAADGAELEVTFIVPGQPAETVSRRVEVGSYYALGFDLSSIPDREMFFRADLARRLQNDVRQNRLTPDSAFGEPLFALAKAYFFNLDRRYDQLAGATGMLYLRQSSLVVAGLEWRGGQVVLALDLLRNVITPISPDGNGELERQFMLLSGLYASAYEALVLEDLTRQPALSTAALFELARKEEVPLWFATEENWRDLSPGFDLPADRLQEIREQTLDRGWAALFPGQVGFGGLPDDAFGFAAIDPETFSADFRLAGLGGGLGAGDEFLRYLTEIIKKSPNPKDELQKLISTDNFSKSIVNSALRLGEEVPVLGSAAKMLAMFDGFFDKLSIYGAFLGHYAGTWELTSQLAPGSGPCPLSTSPPTPIQLRHCPPPANAPPKSCLEAMKEEAAKKIINDYFAKSLAMVKPTDIFIPGGAGQTVSTDYATVVLSVSLGIVMTTHNEMLKARIDCLVSRAMDDPAARLRLEKFIRVTLAAGLGLRGIEMYNKYMVQPAFFGTPGVLF